MRGAAAGRQAGDRRGAGSQQPLGHRCPWAPCGASTPAEPWLHPPRRHSPSTARAVAARCRAQPGAEGGRSRPHTRRRYAGRGWWRPRHRGRILANQMHACPCQEGALLSAEPVPARNETVARRPRDPAAHVPARTSRTPLEPPPAPGHMPSPPTPVPRAAPLEGGRGAFVRTSRRQSDKPCASAISLTEHRREGDERRRKTRHGDGKERVLFVSGVWWGGGS